jgi:Protein of unknown function (DUF2934)
MSDKEPQEPPTSTATTAETEPEVVAAIASGEGQLEEEEVIRQRAYAIWEAEGRPHGHDLDHWHRAQAEITAAASRQDGPAASPPKRKASRRSQ